MKIILEAADIAAALVRYLREEMHIEAEADHIVLKVVEDVFTATIVDARPRLEPGAAYAGPALHPVTATPSPQPPPQPFAKPLTEALDEVREKVDWTENSAMSTDLASLGKRDPTDVSDELGPAR